MGVHPLGLISGMNRSFWLAAFKRLLYSPFNGSPAKTEADEPATSLLVIQYEKREGLLNRYTIKIINALL
jgi:hypothetical protein